jgi:hypothetical protein
MLQEKLFCELNGDALELRLYSYICVFSSFDFDETDRGQSYAKNCSTRLAHRFMLPDCLCVHMKSCK